MRINKTIFVFSLLILPLVMTGCKTASEKAAEKIIEGTSNGQVKVDIDDDKTTVETQYGIGEVGENVNVPEDFPTDVYIIDGTIKTSYKNAGQSGWTLSIETDKSVSEAKDLYEQKLKEAGWNMNAVLDMGNAATLSGTKDNRTVSVMISKDNASGKTTVLVGSSEN